MAIPIVGAPVVKHWLTVVIVECPHCRTSSTVMLVGAQMAPCPMCGAPHALGAINWSGPGSVPDITIGVGAPTKVIGTS